MRQQLTFMAPEFQTDGSFHVQEYTFIEGPDRGWNVYRGGQEHLRLGPGYTVMKSQYCGVCSTDLARHFLPFDLPQITGHEVVVHDGNRYFVVDINASHKARGQKIEDCPYCCAGLENHCPERLTLGIDRLPGGFSPYLLAPINALVPVPDNISPMAASFTEPFAAALQSVEATVFRSGDRVAVLGPRRLGMLVIAALAGVRSQQGLDIEIVALVRHAHLAPLCLKLGADQVINTNDYAHSDLHQLFDVVYDTTANEGGFADALAYSRRVVHLKSTHGREVMGCHALTHMVIDEIALLPYHADHFSYRWPLEKHRHNCNIYVADSVPAALLSATRKDHPHMHFHQMRIDAAAKILMEVPSDVTAGSVVPQFDLAWVTRMEEADQLLCGLAGRSLVRPRGAILLSHEQAGGDSSSALLEAICQRGIEVHTSRCGDFERALAILSHHRHITETFEQDLISHTYDLSNIDTAFSIAADSSQGIKVMVATGGSDE